MHHVQTFLERHIIMRAVVGLFCSCVLKLKDGIKNVTCNVIAFMKKNFNKWHVLKYLKVDLVVSLLLVLIQGRYHREHSRQLTLQSNH